ncbi:hypothetical protein M409DRAFT_28454 [Zasmidium cellare ATCC 36951]|uniref:RING-type domain-containing protein n=1 Tax=Zasmidium cellare ATCC 36951 TaxID=1080233 RepID=A0A6A6C223_ZASCE|nr:uncharacterized protein M409DRAFT_28454 [Zasmidium cellare ATCC 36951]KAF2161124.1 hypothetical protein M409DRAFT_28454 [Zasmidium cellare ATCC 36951]
MASRDVDAIGRATKYARMQDDTTDAGERPNRDKLAELAKSFARLFPRRVKKECQYCCENKPMKVFAVAMTVPHGCRGHLRQVCKTCLRASLSAQLDSKPLLEVGCPSCSTPWDSEDLRVLLGHKDKKRFKELDLLAKAQGLVPSELPEAVTLDEMLVRGE